MPPVPNFPKIYNEFIRQGLRPHQASIKAHAIIRAHVESEKAENSESDEEEEDDETDSRRVISKELEKMKLTAAKLSNHYKQDKKLLLLIKYITNILRKY